MKPKHLLFATIAVEIGLIVTICKYTKADAVSSQTTVVNPSLKCSSENIQTKEINDSVWMRDDDPLYVEWKEYMKKREEEYKQFITLWTMECPHCKNPIYFEIEKGRIIKYEMQDGKYTCRTPSSTIPL